MLSWLGYALLLIGSLLAIGAVTMEWISQRRLARVERKRRRFDRGHNPWKQRLNLADLGFRIKSERLRSSHPAYPTSDAGGALIAVAEHMTDWMTKREQLLADDWEAQRRLDERVHAELLAHAERLSQQDRKRQRRLLVEMIGLACATIGTALADLPL